MLHYVLFGTVATLGGVTPRVALRFALRWTGDYVPLCTSNFAPARAIISRQKVDESEAGFT